MRNARANEPLVTVITPAYNVGHYIGEAVRSVLAQTQSEFEYLICDDGSTDDTAAGGEAAAGGDERVRVLRLSHRGSGAARNAGLRAARGQYIAFLDGDDRWSPNFLEKLVAALRSAPTSVGAVFCGSSHIDPSGKSLGKTVMVHAGPYDVRAMLVGNFPPSCGSCLLVRKTCFNEAGNFDEELQSCVDAEMWLRINTRSQTPLFWFVPEALVEWRVRPGSISSQSTVRVEALQIVLDRYQSAVSAADYATAHTWPAVLAFYCGDDVRGNRWLQLIKGHDRLYFLRSKDGVILAIFDLLPPNLARHLRHMAQSIMSAATASYKLRMPRTMAVLPRGGKI